MIAVSPTRGHEQEIRPDSLPWVEVDTVFASSSLTIRKLERCIQPASPLSRSQNLSEPSSLAARSCDLYGLPCAKLPGSTSVMGNGADASVNVLLLRASANVFYCATVMG